MNTHPPIDHNQAWQTHHEKWEPAIAAWRAAKLWRELADLLPKLTPAAVSAIHNGLEQHMDIVPDVVKVYTDRADRLEAACPLPMVPTDEDRDAFGDSQAELSRGMSYEDRKEHWLALATDADIGAEMAALALAETLGEAEPRG